MLDGVSLIIPVNRVVTFLRSILGGSKRPWVNAESSVRHARLRVRELWKRVEGMPGNRDDVFAALAQITPRLHEAEEALIAARRACEDIDREKERLSAVGDPRLAEIWKLHAKQQIAGDEEQGDVPEQ